MKFSALTEIHKQWGGGGGSFIIALMLSTLTYYMPLVSFYTL